MAVAVSRAALLFWYAPYPTDIRIYFGWVVRAAAGRTALVDFPIEYPPLAWWIMQIPGTTDRLAYYFRFRALMAAADVVSFVLLAWVVSRRRPALLTAFAWVYMGTTLILAHELYDRLDLGVLFFLAIALAAWMKGSSAHEGAGVSAAAGGVIWWRAAAYVAVGLGTAYKLFPAIVAPLFVLSELLTRTKLRRIALHAALFVAMAIGPVALTYWQIGTRAFDFLRYHGARGLEIGSVWASVMWVLSFAGYHAEVVIRYGSWELAGTAEGAVWRAAWLSSMLVPALLAAWALVLRGRFDGGRAYVQTTLAVASVVVVSNVMSPQFLLWAIPLIALAAVEGCATKRAFFLVGAWLLICAALTLLVYEGGGMIALNAMKTWVMLALLARNVVYVSLWAYLVAALIKRDRAMARAN